MFVELILCSVFLFLLYLFAHDEHPKDFPPGPKRIKFLGNLHQLAKHAKLAPFVSLEKFSKIYGPIMGLKLGLRQQVVINDFDLMKEVLCSEVWVDRYFDEWVANRSFGKPLGIIMVGGDPWREMRRFTMKTLRDFGFGRQKSMEGAIEEELVDLLARVTPGVTPMKQFFNVSVLNILWSLVAGVRFAPSDPKVTRLVTLIDQMSKSFPVAGNPFIIFPFLRPLEQLTSKGRLRKSFYTAMQNFFRDEIAVRRAQGSYKDVQRDFFDVFLSEIDKRKEDEGFNHYTEEQLIIVAYDLFAAGSETTSNTLEFAILYLLTRPEIQKEIQKEVDSVVGRSRLPNTLDRPSMPYTEATLLEVQRMANVLPMSIRSPTETTKLGKYIIPKGAIGTLNLHAMHMSKEIWGDPEVFRPERFLEIDANGVRRVINAHKILPFGAGKRVCLGEALARASLFTYLTAFLQRFDFRLPPGHPMPSTQPVVGFTLSPMEYSALITSRN